MMISLCASMKSTIFRTLRSFLVCGLLATATLADQPMTRIDATGARAVGLVSSLVPPQQAEQPGAGPRGLPDWMPLGPAGGDVQAVVVSPVDATLLLAGTAPQGSFGGGLYRSTDSGETWARVGPSFTGNSVYDIEFAPDGSAYAGSIFGLFKSTNGGMTWTHLTLGIGFAEQILDIHIDPTNPNNVWAGVGDNGGGQAVNVLRSTNAGGSWTNVTPPLSAPQSCSGIAIDPTNTNNVCAVFAGAFGGGQVWVSTNGNAATPTWTNRSAGLPNRPINGVVHDGTRFLVVGGQLFGGQDVGLYASTNLGVTWTPLHDGTWPTLAISGITVDPANPLRIFVAANRSGIYRSTDGGVSWQFGVGGTADLSANSIRFAPGNADRLVAGVSLKGVYQTTDGGDTFVANSRGINEVSVFSVTANPHNLQELAISFQGQNDGGVYTSTDGGQTWVAEPVPPTRWNGTRFNYDGTLYAISTGPTTIAAEGIYRRNPGGDWVSVGPDQGGLFESELFSLRGSRTNPDLLIAVGNDFGVAGFEATIWRTANGGDDWFKVYEGPEGSESVQAVEFVEDGTDQTMVAVYRDLGEVQDGGALRSVDNGQSWQPAMNGLPTLAHGADLEASPADINTFMMANRDFTAGQGGTWITTDTADNWSNTGFTSPISGIAWDGHDDRRIYVTSFSTAVLRSTDGGASFVPFTTGLPSSLNVQAMSYVGGTNARLYLATTTGVYVTELNDPCLGDTDFDHSVGLSDLATLLSNFGTGVGALYSDGDITGDGAIDLADLATLLANFGAACP